MVPGRLLVVLSWKFNAVVLADRFNVSMTAVAVPPWRLPDRLPLTPKVNLSTPVPPVRFSILLNEIVEPAIVSVPPLAELMDHVASTAGPVSVSASVPEFPDIKPTRL